MKPIEIMRWMTHNSLDTYRKKGSKAPLKAQVEARKGQEYNNGAVFVSRSKDLLSNGQGYVITSYETLEEQYNNLTHWTPNTFRHGTYKDERKRYIAGHTSDNLKQINSFAIDIDTKQMDLYALFLGCDELEIPRPNLLLSTPNGYQAFFILERPFYIKKDDDKALRTAQRVSDNLRSALKRYVPVDVNCAPFGFYRVPNDENIMYFDEMPVKSELLVAWSKVFEQKQGISRFSVVSGGRFASQTANAWYQELITHTGISKGFYGAGRNNALFTLALANYADEIPYEAAYDELDQFNSQLESPLSKNDFERVLKSAYSGRYAGPKREHVDHLLELWGQGASYESSVQGWYKFKKPRAKRQRSHYNEREQDIVTYIETHTSPSQPFLKGSLRELAKKLGMAFSTLKEVFKRTKTLFKVTKGRGRSGVTYLTTRSMLFKHYLELRRASQVQAAATREYLTKDGYLTIFDFPVLDEILAEFRRILNKGASPPFNALTG